MTAGIYQLSFGDAKYIGRSQNIEHRFKSHISDMRSGKSSKKLLSAYIESGVPALHILVEALDVSTQKILEIQYIAKFDTVNNGLNTTYGGEDILYGELNVNSKYTNDQIYSVLKLLAYSKDMTLSEMSSTTGVSLPVVRDISAGTKHLWLATEYPLEYSIMLDNKTYRHSRSLANLTDKHRFQSTFDRYPLLLSPQGLVVTIEGSLSSFAESNNLQVGNLSSVLHGRRNSHKGWKLYRGETS